jgi:hypothetical protein
MLHCVFGPFPPEKKRLIDKEELLKNIKKNRFCLVSGAVKDLFREGLEKLGSSANPNAGLDTFIRIAIADLTILLKTLNDLSDLEFDKQDK